MHRIFQYNLYLLRLEAARQYVQSLQMSLTPVTTEEQPVRLAAQVRTRREAGAGTGASIYENDWGLMLNLCVLIPLLPRKAIYLMLKFETIGGGGGEGHPKSI